jgi:hypothetical protein
MKVLGIYSLDSNSTQIGKLSFFAGTIHLLQEHPFVIETILGQAVL